MAPRASRPARADGRAWRLGRTRSAELVGRSGRAYLPYFTKESAVSVDANGRRYESGSWNCVGGQSVFYGGASFRFRESDFTGNPEVVGDSGAEWPFGYDGIEPF